MEFLRYAFFGILWGFFLCQVGLTDYNEVHRMLVLQDLRLILTFGSALFVAMLGYAIFRAKERKCRVRFNMSVVPGAILFGIGWGLTGGCPAIPLVQLGQGYLAALFVIAGIFIGIVGYPAMYTRFFGGTIGNVKQ